MKCSQVLERLSACLDGELDGATLEAVEKHLGLCPACREEFAALRSVVDLASGVFDVDPPPTLRGRIAAATTGRKEVSPLRALKAWFGAPAVRWAACIGAAAALVVGVVLSDGHQPETRRARIEKSALQPVHAARPSPAPPKLASPEPVVVADRPISIHHRVVSREVRAVSIPVLKKAHPHVIRPAPSLEPATATEPARVAEAPTQPEAAEPEVKVADSSPAESKEGVQAGGVVKIPIPATSGIHNVDSYFGNVKEEARMKKRADNTVKLILVSRRF